MTHFITFLSYLALACLIALGGPDMFGLTVVNAGFLGLITFLLCALAHEFWFRREQSKHLALGFEALSQVLAEMNQNVQSNAARIDTNVSELQDQYTKQQELASVRTEIDMLQRLVARLSGKPVKPKVVKTPAKIASIPKDKEALMEMVRDGLRADRVDLYLQPVVSLPQRKTRYYECYSRIRNKKDEIILPEHYVGLAETDGIIASIDNMLLFRCIQLIRRAQRDHEHTGFFCNLSRHTLLDKHFFGDFVEFLAENKVLAESIVFEVPQAEVDSRDKEVEDLLKRLSEIGCQLSLQHVTTLKFDAAYLYELGFNFVKIAHEQIRPYLEGDNPGADLTKVKMKLDQRGIDMIVEKIEKESELLDLLDYNIDYGQGFLFGAPVLSESVEH